MGWHPEKQMHAVLASLKKAALKVRAQEQVSGRSETTEISRKKCGGPKVRGRGKQTFATYSVKGRKSWVVMDM